MKWMVLRPIETFRLNGSVQCRAGRNRSISDICIAARDNLGYTGEEAIRNLAEWIKRNYTKVSILFCFDINKVVFRNRAYGSFGKWPEYVAILSAKLYFSTYSKAQLIAKNALLENLANLK